MARPATRRGQDGAVHLVSALREWWAMQANERDGRLPEMRLVRDRWKAVRTAWGNVGARAESVYRTARASWESETGRCGDCGSRTLCSEEKIR